MLSACRRTPLAVPVRAFASDASRAYRELLRAQRQLFGEDARARAAAITETREQFALNADVRESEVASKVQDARDAAAFLRHNVAQTVRDDDSGNFVLTPQPEHISRSKTPEPLPDGLEGTPISEDVPAAADPRASR
mmetsp:Transcript_42992/g.140099  ORF Transcript_42992/g.140099 Transcript_42992/m.140099 type:complete len:137 (-) Transcript_42992:232-642(-)